MAFKQRKGRTKKIKGGISFKERVSVRTEIKLRKFHCSFSQIQQRKNSQKPKKKNIYIYIQTWFLETKRKLKRKRKKKRINEKLSSYKNRVLWILCNYWNINFSFFLFPSDSRILVSQKTKKKKNKNPSKRNFQTTNNKEETKKKKRKRNFPEKEFGRKETELN